MLQEGLITPREIVKKKFLKVCEMDENFASLNDDVKMNIIRRLERSCLNKTIESCKNDLILNSWNDPKFIERYSTVTYMHLSNLNKNGVIVSPTYLKKICEGVIDPKCVMDMTSYEMCPEATETERELLKIRLNQKVKEKYTDRHPCKNCGSNKVKYIETSGRSLGLDEISMFHFTCDECEYTWMK